MVTTTKPNRLRDHRANVPVIALEARKQERGTAMTYLQDQARALGPVDDNRVILIDSYYGYRYPVPNEYESDIMASEDERWQALAAIGIERREDRTPLQAWRDAVADESGIARDRLDPSTGRGLDLAFSPAYVRTFVLYLA